MVPRRDDSGDKKNLSDDLMISRDSYIDGLSIQDYPYYFS